MSGARRRSNWPLALVTIAGAAAIITVSVLLQRPAIPEVPVDGPDETLQQGSVGNPGDPGDLEFARLKNPARSVLRRNGRAVATFTDGARTVLLRGPERTFAEPKNTKAKVVTRAWVRLAPRAWRKKHEKSAWVREWLESVRDSEQPDILGAAMQYVHGAKERKNRKGVRFRGDASFGPRLPNGDMREESDWNDYLGAKWRTPGGEVRRPKPDHYGSLDCSGFVRMVYGYRAGYPMDFLESSGKRLPRRAHQMRMIGPGMEILKVPKGRRATDLDRLQPGDLLFFNHTPDDDVSGGHSAIYLGVDSDGHNRFVSSRKVANGPTMGDAGGESRIDGDTMYAGFFRKAKRL